MTDFQPFRMEARAWIPKCDEEIYGGVPKMFYQNDQYLSSFLRRVYAFECKEHPSYTHEVLMWWFGLKDKNGRKIFEGDILSITGDAELEDDGSGIGLVYFDQEKGRMAWQYNLPLCPWNPDVSAWAHKSLIIGNIFENPELMTIIKV